MLYIKCRSGVCVQVDLKRSEFLTELRFSWRAVVVFSVDSHHGSGSPGVYEES